jgi:hypothetical protein
MSEEIKEGWGVIRPGDRVAHYYRGMDSLCRKIGFYRGPLEPDDFASSSDCKACRRAVDKLKAAEKQLTTE